MELTLLKYFLDCLNRFFPKKRLCVGGKSTEGHIHRRDRPSQSPYFYDHATLFFDWRSLSRPRRPHTFILLYILAPTNIIFFDGLADPLRRQRRFSLFKQTPFELLGSKGDNFLLLSPHRLYKA